MLGKRMRCPNKVCGHVFLVDGQSPSRAAPPDQPPSSGNVGQVVPMLPTEPSSPPEVPLSPWHQNPAGWKPPAHTAKIVLEPAPEEEPATAPGTTEADWRNAPPRDRGKGSTPARPPASSPPARTTGAPPVPPRQPEPPASVGNDWRNAPPPQRSGAAAEAAPAPVVEHEAPPAAPAPFVATVIEESEPDAPIEMPAGSWEAPPVRRNDLTAQIPELAAPLHDETAKRKRRRSWMIIGVIFAIVAVGVGVPTFIVLNRIEGKKRDLVLEAREKYDEGLFSIAQGLYEDLLRDNPGNEEFAFMVELCRIRKAPTDPTMDPVKTLDEMARFLRQNDKNPYMQRDLRGLGETYMRIVREHVIEQIERQPKPEMSDDIQAAERTLAEFEGELAPGVTQPERQEIRGKFDRVREIIAKEIERQKNLALLHELKPTQEGLVNGELMLREFGLQADPEARAIIEELYRQHKKIVTYTSEPAAMPTIRRSEETDTLPTYLVDPRVGGVPPNMPQEEGTVLALVRGVLYALRQHDGAVEWAMRVGIDTTTLPVRVPATPSSPELILVLSADTYTLRALDLSGRQVWKYHMTAPSLGRPVIIKNRAFFSTFDGQIHEIELAKGELLGRYSLGEGVKLSGGGVHWQDTNLVFFPADEFCVYVIDVDKHVCEKILYTKHRSGSLRGEPIIAGWTERDQNGQKVHQGYLFMNFTEDLNSMRLRAYPLPIEDPRGEPLPMNPEPRVQGWIWFKAHQDAEKIIQVTDDGKLALVGVQQRRTADNPLFLLVLPNPEEKGQGQGQDLVKLLKPEPFELLERSRAQIAFAAEPDNFWVLAFGRLMRMRLLLAAKTGPIVRPAQEWLEGPQKGPISLGSPLHEAQYFEYPFEAGAEKSPTLMLVTEPLNREVCLATAVDAEKGTIRWQRQLGLVSRGEPLMLGNSLIALDQGGSLAKFDPAKRAGAKDQWLVGSLSIALSLDEGETPPVLLPGPDGKSAYELAIPKVPKGTQANLIVRRIVEQGGPLPVVQEIRHPLRDQFTLAGKPAINKSGILVPLSDGSILRFGLDGKYFGQGPSWKLDREDPEARTYCVWLNDEEFITTQGGRNINRWQWKPGKNQFFILPPQVNPADPTIRMPADIVTEPLALPPAKDGEGVRLLVACDDKTLYLVEGRVAESVMKVGDEGLKIQQGKQFKTNGKITGGPFPFIDQILVIVDRNRLLCFKPGDRDPVWEYKSEGEAIVGRPQLVDDMLLIADQSGRFVGIDPKTGKARGDGYTLKANVGPAASPVAFGPNQAFAPLTDGTILLLDPAQMRRLQAAK
jgi:outer membrane protein assembly factor BamB